MDLYDIPNVKSQVKLDPVTKTLISTKSKESHSKYIKKVTPVAGGVLADAMGLGYAFITLI